MTKIHLQIEKWIVTFFWIRTAGKTVERSDTRGHSLRQVLPHSDHAFTSSFVFPRATRICHISRLCLPSVCPAWAGPARPFRPRLAQSGTFNRSVLALPPALSLIDTLNIFYNPFQFLLTFFFSNFDLMQSGDYFHLHFSFLKDFESFAILNFFFSFIEQSENLLFHTDIKLKTRTCKLPPVWNFWDLRSFNFVNRFISSFLE